MRRSISVLLILFLFLLYRKPNLLFPDTTGGLLRGLEVTHLKGDSERSERQRDEVPMDKIVHERKRVPILSIALAEENSWHSAKSTHFIIYYRSVQEDFLTLLIDRAEDYYNKIADDLGFRRYNFWLWDNRAKIYIYDDVKSYQVSTGQPAWSSGATIPKDKIIHTFPGEKGFLETILPHEMGHIIFREFVGFDNNAIPFWLDEGVAGFQEKLRRSIADRSVREAVKNDRFIDLEKLSSLNPYLIQDTELVNLFYAESVNLIDYLIKEFGSDNFVFFCQELRDKKDLEKAIALAYPFENIRDLDRAWQRYLKE